MDYTQEWNTLYDHVRGAVIEGLQRHFDDESDDFVGSQLHAQFIIFKDIYDLMTVAEYGETIDLQSEAYDTMYDDYDWWNYNEDAFEDIPERDSEVAE